MNGLVLKLAPGERVLVNGAVIENGDRRTRLTLLTPGAHVLRLRDAIHPSEATTPVRRVCYVAQLADVFTDAESVAALDAAASHAMNGRFYPALRALRSILPREAMLLAADEGAGRP